MRYLWRLAAVHPMATRGRPREHPRHLLRRHPRHPLGRRRRRPRYRSLPSGTRTPPGSVTRRAVGGWAAMAISSSASSTCRSVSTTMPPRARRVLARNSNATRRWHPDPATALASAVFSHNPCCHRRTSRPRCSKSILHCHRRSNRHHLTKHGGHQCTEQCGCDRDTDGECND